MISVSSPENEVNGTGICEKEKVLIKRDSIPTKNSLTACYRKLGMTQSWHGTSPEVILREHGITVKK